MIRFIPVFILIILFSSCRKSESDFSWEKSYGKGEALFLKASSDSGFIACGEKEGKPYFIRLDKNRKLVIDFGSDLAGLFSSAWFDTSGYISAGNSGGKMLLMRNSKSGIKLWEKSLDAGFKIDYTSLFYTGSGELLAIGTARPDSSGIGATGLLFVRFDTTGNVIIQKKISETVFVAASDAAIDKSGNIFLPITRKSTGSKTKASVAKYNDQFVKIWETDLYNNPSFGAASQAIKLDATGNVYVGGNTEVSTKDGTLNNSFLASLTLAGSVKWKTYLENSNSGTSLMFNDIDNIMMLNRNCFVISVLNLADGTDAGTKRMFSVCASDNTDAFGSDFDLNYDRNILLAGKLGGNFYLALKAAR
jgi:hypothetical protein